MKPIIKTKKTIFYPQIVFTYSKFRPMYGEELWENVTVTFPENAEVKVLKKEYVKVKFEGTFKGKTTTKECNLPRIKGVLRWELNFIPITDISGMTSRESVEDFLKGKYIPDKHWVEKLK
jgi:hypothetical protein